MTRSPCRPMPLLACKIRSDAHLPKPAMTFLQMLFHLMGLFMPALAMAVLMPLAGRWVMGPGGLGWFQRVLGHALVGSAVLALGLVLQGHDGRMGTYAVLVLVAGTLEWLMHRASRRR